MLFLADAADLSDTSLNRQPCTHTNPSAGSRALAGFAPINSTTNKYSPEAKASAQASSFTCAADKYAMLIQA